MKSQKNIDFKRLNSDSHVTLKMLLKSIAGGILLSCPTELHCDSCINADLKMVKSIHLQVMFATFF